MIKKYNFNISFKWFDFWVGWFWDKDAKALYICLLPMLPIKIWVSVHQVCPDCGSAMDKLAIDTGDGWALFWDCENHPGDSEIEIPWDMDLKGREWVTSKELRRLGYEIN